MTTLHILVLSDRAYLFEMPARHAGHLPEDWPVYAYWITTYSSLANAIDAVAATYPHQSVTVHRQGGVDR